MTRSGDVQGRILRVDPVRDARIEPSTRCHSVTGEEWICFDQRLCFGAVVCQYRREQSFRE
jgi:hypothetical protein